MHAQRAAAIGMLALALALGVSATIGSNIAPAQARQLAPVILIATPTLPAALAPALAYESAPTMPPLRVEQPTAAPASAGQVAEQLAPASAEHPQVAEQLAPASAGQVAEQPAQVAEQLAGQVAEQPAPLVDLSQQPDAAPTCDHYVENAYCNLPIGQFDIKNMPESYDPPSQRQLDYSRARTR